jgi:uncharacterized membrane protein
MVSIIDLWQPILLSAVLVFVASSVIHMLLGWHNSDFKKFAAEDAVMDALRPFNLAPASYVAPRPDSMAQMSSPEFKAKMARGPRFALTILRDTSMAQNLVVWFLYSIVVAVFAAYVASLTLSAGAPYMTVFRITSAVTFAAYVLALWHDWIWYSSGLGATLKSTIDGLIYALLTGGAFGWLWP